MRKIVVSLVIGLVTGFSLSFLSSDREKTSDTGWPASGTGDLAKCEQDLLRVGDLDQAQRDQRDDSSLLLDEIDRLQSVVESLTARELEASSFGDDDWLERAWADLASNDEPADRRQMLIDASFTPARSDWILQRESELQLAAASERYRDPDGQGIGGYGQFDYLNSRLEGRLALREEIGDYEYEQYLAATGQSTTISLTRVMDNSPAQNAGLQVGDEIVDYDGTRVFNIIELANRASEGPVSEAVIVNIRRDGAPMQLVLPRGQLGVSGGSPTRY